MRPSVIRTDARKVAHHNGPHLHGRVTRSQAPVRGKVGQLAARGSGPANLLAVAVTATSLAVPNSQAAR